MTPIHQLKIPAFALVTRGNSRPALSHLHIPVKGTSVTLKKGMVIKKIHLTEDEDEIECPVEKIKIVLKPVLKKGANHQFCSRIYNHACYFAETLI